VFSSGSGLGRGCQAPVTMCLEQRHLPVEEWPAPGTTVTGSACGAPSRRWRPAHHVVGFAVDDERVGRHRRRRRRSAPRGRPAPGVRGFAGRQPGGSLRRDIAPKEKPPSTSGWPARGGLGSPPARRRLRQRRGPSARPRRRRAEVEAHARVAQATSVRASVCTILLSIVPPCCGCGWHSTARPRGAPSGGSSMAHAMAPAGPAMALCRVRDSSADVGGSSKRSTTRP